MSTIKKIVKEIPIVSGIARRIYGALMGGPKNEKAFTGSKAYWEEHYAKGGTSGTGSYGQFAEFKAEVLNSFVNDNNIETVVEFGCGDGNQLTLANYPQYMGFDVSQTAVDLCAARFDGDAAKSFRLLDTYAGEKAELALSIDVIYHLVEDSIFENHMNHLFDAATRFVIIYSSDIEENEGYGDASMKHRKFTRWIETNRDGWLLAQHIPNKYPYKGDFREGSSADFYIYKKSA